MSITKRFVDLAKSNLNSLLEKAAETADPRRKLSNLSDAELEAELERRRSMRDGEAAVNAARARVDAPEPAKPAPAEASKPAGAAESAAKPANGVAGAASDREARAQAAREREARVKAARDQREREARVKDEAATAQIRARAQQAAQQAAQARAKNASPPPNGSGGGAGANAGRKAPRNADPMVVQYYARLEVTYGAPWDEVKIAYRKLMRRYHPDLHAHSPEKLKAATEVAQALTQAYNELDKILNQ